MALRTTLQSLRVDGTGFLAPFALDFSPGLNCIIGARGTGKTSVVELIRFAAGREDDTKATSSSVGQLVPAALGDSGWVELDLSTDLGQELTIRRDVTGSWTATDRATNADADIDWPALGVYALAIFSQNQLEEIATSPSARLATLDSFCGNSVDRLQYDLQDLRQRLSTNAAQQVQLANEIETLRAQGEQLPKLEAELAVVDHQYQQLLKEMAGQDAIKKQVQELGDQRQQLLREDGLLTGLVSAAEAALIEPFPGRGLGGTLRQALSEDSISPLPDRERLRLLRGRVAEFSHQYASLRDQMTALLAGVRDAVSVEELDVSVRLQKVTKQYQDATAALGAISNAWKTIAAKRDSLLAQVRLLQTASASIDQKQRIRETLITERTALLNRFHDLRRTRFQVRRDAAAALNQAIGGTVVVEVTESGDPSLYEQFLLDAFRGSGLWYSRLATSISRHIPPVRLAEMARLGDVKALSGLTTIDADRARRALLHLADVNIIHSLEVVDVDDSVRFWLEVDGGELKESDLLSQGQKCTTVLSLLLVDSSEPLVIDQPEDNLDNSYVVETVVDVVSRQKDQRQFVFVTHNPNIPVLASAETVVVMDAYDGRGTPTAVGPWDRPDISDRILSVMEGGRLAFKRRQIAYEANTGRQSVAR